MMGWVRDNIAVIALAITGVSWGTRLEVRAGDNRAAIQDHGEAIKDIGRTSINEAKELQKQIYELRETAATIKEQNTYIIKQLDELKRK